MSDDTPQWSDVEGLFNDLRADGYEVVDMETSTSEPADDKLVWVAVER